MRQLTQGNLNIDFSAAVSQGLKQKLSWWLVIHIFAQAKMQCCPSCNGTCSIDEHWTDVRQNALFERSDRESKGSRTAERPSVDHKHTVDLRQLHSSFSVKSSICTIVLLAIVPICMWIALPGVATTVARSAHTSSAVRRAAATAIALKARFGALVAADRRHYQQRALTARESVVPVAQADA